MGDATYVYDALIANGASLSQAMKFGNATLVGLNFPAAWTAAALTFLASDAEGGTYNTLRDKDGVEFTMTVAADGYYQLPPDVFAGIRWLQLRSGIAGAVVAQGGARTIKCVTRPVG